MTASATAKPADAAPNILPFAVMCVGMFVALLDIQIVASSLQDIGGGLSAAQDDISWVQTAYLIAEITVIPSALRPALGSWPEPGRGKRPSLAQPPALRQILRARRGLFETGWRRLSRV